MTPDQRGDERASSLRRGPSSYWFYRGLPLFYPIVASFLPGETEQQCAEGSYLSHTLGGWEALFPTFSLIIPRIEPRVLLTAAQLGTHEPGRHCRHSEVYPGGGSIPWVYNPVYIPWWVPCIYPGWDTSLPVHTQVGYLSSRYSRSEGPERLLLLPNSETGGWEAGLFLHQQ